ncbi:MAG: chorismate mutase [Kiritimatiellae bacterium]|nr:chorismate mutase [Kiritimatiellia bacterium]
MKELKDIRDEINGIDESMRELFVRRLAVAAEVAEAKRAQGAPVLNPEREREILSRVAKEVGPDMENEARLFFTTLFSISRGRQRAALQDENALVKQIADAVEKTPDQFPSLATVACPGTEGAYSQQATSQLFSFPTILYFRNFENVCGAVEKGMCDYGVLPIENSAVGSVPAIYDAMAQHQFKIVRAMRMRIRHVLLAPKGVKLSDVKEVTSHPHAIAQCSAFLLSHPEMRTVPASNTAAAAADLAASGRRDEAVIASRACAELYGLDVLAEDISNVASNYTRFICISKDLQIYPDASKMTLMMSLAHHPGALSGVLAKFASLGVNLSKLESRPVPGSDFEFRFVFDIEASPRDPRVVKLLAGFASDPEIEHFTFLGAYDEK